MGVGVVLLERILITDINQVVEGVDVNPVEKRSE